MRVLVIEDYDPLRKALVQGLVEEGANVDATGDGEEGLWFARDEVYDVIVLDLMLPKVDGLSILKQIRSEGNRNPVLILTAKDQIPDRVRGLDEGADDYLVKPFAFEELMARVRAMMRRKHEISTSQISIGHLRIDLHSRMVYANDHEVALTNMEYSVMEVLATRHGRIVSRTDISDNIYGFDCEPNSNAIDVYIASLRRKLHDPGCPDLIHTRRGLGYQLTLEDD